MSKSKRREQYERDNPILPVRVPTHLKKQLQEEARAIGKSVGEIVRRKLATRRRVHDNIYTEVLDTARSVSNAAKAYLTPRQREILIRMADHRNDEEGELVYESGVAYLGEDRVAARTVFALLRLCVISHTDGAVGAALERFRINETGLQAIGKR